ncbi:MAG: DUF190 domain-containing protein, partial [Phycisphaerales bacterium]
MKLDAPGTRLTTCIGESDQHQHRPLDPEIVRGAGEAELAGTTVRRGSEGIGASSRLHIERIGAFLPVPDRLIGDGSVVREAANIILDRDHQP